MDTRIVECQHCHGDRFIESEPYAVNYNNGDALTHISQCPVCNGTGVEEITVEPVTLDDI